MRFLVFFLLIILAQSCKYASIMYDIPSALKKNKVYMLDLQNQNIDSLPYKLADVKIKSINLRGNTKLNLERTFNVLKNIKGLENIYLDSMDIEKLPPNITELKNLKTITLNYSTSLNIDSSIKLLSKLTKLEVLSFYDCNVNHIPSSIDKISNLTHIDFGDNNIDSIPKEIFHLKNLKTLDLRENRITRIDINALNTLHKLRILDLTKNSLNYDELLKLAQLQNRLYILFIAGNNVTEKEKDLLNKVLPKITFYLFL